MEENSRWIPVKNNKTSSDVRCQQMHCGTAVRPSRDDDNGTQLTCTGNYYIYIQLFPQTTWEHFVSVLSTSEQRLILSLQLKKTDPPSAKKNNMSNYIPSTTWTTWPQDRLSILFSPDNVTVELTGRCYGVVQVKVNGLTHPVCASAWTQAEADVVCNELNCGTVSCQLQLSV